MNYRNNNSPTFKQYHQKIIQQSKEKCQKLPILQIRMSQNKMHTNLRKPHILLTQNITDLNQHALILQSSVSKGKKDQIPFTSRRSKTLKNEQKSPKNQKQYSNSPVHSGKHMPSRKYFNRPEKYIEMLQKQLTINKDKIEDLSSNIKMQSYLSKSRDEKKFGNSNTSKSLEQKIRNYHNYSTIEGSADQQIMKVHLKKREKKRNLLIYRGHYHKNSYKEKERSFLKLIEAPPTIQRPRNNRQRYRQDPVLETLDYFTEKAQIYTRQYLSLQPKKRSNLLRNTTKKDKGTQMSGRNKKSRSKNSEQSRKMSRKAKKGKQKIGLKQYEEQFDPWEVAQNSTQLPQFWQNIDTQ